jgi:opacity protein-like surface antigen
MKKLLILAALLCCTFGLFADAKPAITQLTFGLGTDFEGDNQLGVTVGVDIDWQVWEKATTKAHDGSGKMYAGLDIAGQWWMPTRHGFKHHYTSIPVQGNFMYEFDTTQMKGAGPLKAVGPWISMGVGLDLGHSWWYEDVPEKDEKGNVIPEKDENGEVILVDGKPKPKTKSERRTDTHFDVSFAWGLGVSLAFNNNWALKAGFGGNAGDHWHKDYFMAEAAYRF